MIAVLKNYLRATAYLDILRSTRIEIHVEVRFRTHGIGSAGLSRQLGIVECVLFHFTWQSGFRCSEAGVSQAEYETSW